MTLFLVFAALLVAITLFLLIRPLRAKTALDDVDRQATNVAIHQERLQALQQARADGAIDDGEFAAARLDLDRLLLTSADDEASPGPAARGKDSGWTGLALLVLVPLGAGLLYQHLGNPGSLQTRLIPQAAQTPPGQPVADGEVQAAPAPAMDEVLNTLRDRLEQEPDNLKGWLMLGRSYTSLERHADAQRTFEQAYRLFPDTPEVLTGYAQAIAQSGAGNFNQQSRDLLDQTLVLAPDHPQALWLRGLASEQQGEPQTALDYWQRLLPQVSGSEQAMLVQFMNETRETLGLAPLSVPEPADLPSIAESVPASPPAPPSQAPAAGGPRITLQVSLDHALRSEINASDTVFIYARAASGPPMPLAVVRKTVADLPLEVTLDDSMAMTPAMKLSSFAQVVVGARVSRSGNAIPQPGDLQGQSSAIESSISEPVRITINQKI